MSLKPMQTAKAKKSFWSPLMDALKSTKTVTELADYMCTTERHARDEVNSIRKHYAVISGSFQKGYRLARPINELNHDEKLQELEVINKTIGEFQARINDMKRTLKPLIAYKKVLEKFIDKND